MKDENIHSCMHDREYNSSGMEAPEPLGRSEMEAMEDGSADSPGGAFQVRTDIRSSNQGGGARGEMFAPFGIVLHHTVGEEFGDLRTLTSPAAQVSSNDYITKQGVIYELVPFPGRAWHAGYSELHGVRDWNDHGWGIEIENWGDGNDPYPSEQIDAIVWRCRERCRALGITGPEMLVRHRDVCVPRGRKTDTSDNFPFEEVKRRVFAATDPTDDENGDIGIEPADSPETSPMAFGKYNFAAIGEADIAVAKAAREALGGVGVSSALADTPEMAREVSQAARDSEPAGSLVCIVVGGAAREHLSPEAREDVGKYELDVSDLWAAIGDGLDETKRVLAERLLPEIWSREAPSLSALLTKPYRKAVGMGEAPVEDVNVLPPGTVWGVSDVEYIVPFHYRRQTSHGLQNLHKGEDVVASEGASILALADGRVVRLREGRPDSGYWQDFTVFYPSVKKYVLYGHVMRGASLAEGARFKKGQRISRIGTLRDALNTTEHTHVQVWNTEAAMLAFDNSAAINPKNVRLALGEGEFEGAVVRAADSSTGGVPENWSCPACVEG